MALILYCGSGGGHFLCAQLHRKTQFVLFQGAKSCFGNRSSGLALGKYCFHVISNAQLHLALGPCANAWCACCLHCVKWERKQKLYALAIARVGSALRRRSCRHLVRLSAQAWRPGLLIEAKPVLQAAGALFCHSSLGQL